VNTGLGALAVAGLMLVALSSCTTVGSAPASDTGASAGASASAGATVSGAALESYDWSTVTLPASSCDSGASGDIALVDGKGTVSVDAQTQYAVSVELPPDFGELGGQPAAAVRYSCVLLGSNGVGAFPIAVFVRGDSRPEPAGILQNADLATTSSGSSLTHDAVSFVDGQLVIAGKYLTENDPRCCPSGQGWTSVAWVGGRLVPSGVVTSGTAPVTLPSAPSSTTSSTAGAVTTGDPIVYSPPVQVQREADLDQLDGAPADFRDFIWGLEQSSGSSDCTAVITVNRLSSKGYASGGLGCAQQGSGSGMLWYDDGGTWKVLAELQNQPTCALLESVHFASDVLETPTCYDADNQTLPYSG
jgi:hypothetical protein